MKIVVNHLTRMQRGYICVAGINPDTGHHVRPIPENDRPRRTQLLRRLAHRADPFAKHLQIDLVVEHLFLGIPAERVDPLRVLEDGECRGTVPRGEPRHETKISGRTEASAGSARARRPRQAVSPRSPTPRGAG